MRNPDVSTTTALERVALRDPTLPVLRYGTTCTTAGDLTAQARAVAAALAQAGVVPGDRIAHVGRNSPALLLTVLAAGHLRAVAAPLGFRASAPELAGLLDHYEPRVVVTEPAHAAAVGAWLSTHGAGDGVALAVVDDDPLASEPGSAVASRWLPWSSLLATAAPDGFACGPPQPDDPAVLLATSGTSGHPKGVVLTHANLWWSAVGADQALATGNGGTTLTVAPMSHIGGLNGLTLRTLATGGTVVLRRGFDPDGVLDDIERYAVTSLFGVPAMYAAMARSPRFGAVDLSSLRTALVGGAPTDTHLIDRYIARGVPLQQSWGMTETAPAGTAVPRDQVTTRGTTVGLPLAFLRLRLVDRGRDVTEPDVPGELWVSGPQVTAGYWRDSAATAAAFEEPGWLRTGDVAVREADGYYRVCGRIDDVINTGGEKVHPAEVEAALTDAPGVQDCAVVGRPDEVWGEAVEAVVVPKPGSVVTLADLREHAGRVLGRHKLPRHLTVVAALPHNTAGKVDRNALRHTLVP